MTTEHVSPYDAETKDDAPPSAIRLLRRAIPVSWLITVLFSATVSVLAVTDRLGWESLLTLGVITTFVILPLVVIIPLAYLIAWLVTRSRFTYTARRSHAIVMGVGSVAVACMVIALAITLFWAGTELAL